MNMQTLKVEERAATGKGGARKIRAQGKIPGVLYGRELEPTALACSPSDIRTVFKSKSGRNSVLQLEIDGREPVSAMLKDVQRHPVSRKILHLDFVRVFEDRPVEVDVEIHLLGKPVGVAAGGVLKQVARSARIRALPSEIPEVIEVDVTPMKAGDALSISDIKLPENVSAVYKVDYRVAHVSR